MSAGYALKALRTHAKRPKDGPLMSVTPGEAAQLVAVIDEMLEALKLMQAALTEYHLRDVKKRFSLCVADAAASKAIAKAEGA